MEASPAKSGWPIKMPITYPILLQCFELGFFFGPYESSTPNVRFFCRDPGILSKNPFLVWLQHLVKGAVLRGNPGS